MTNTETMTAKTIKSLNDTRNAMWAEILASPDRFGSQWHTDRCNEIEHCNKRLSLLGVN